VEAQTDIQTYLEQGKQALASGQAREAAIAYAHGAQLEPDNPQVHLGLAEANLALGDDNVVQMACRRVQELQPTGGIEGMTAQALLDLLDKRYDRALQYIDAVISQDPSIAYVHALRSYLLRAQGQDYDANLARARASRLSYGGRFDNVFPQLEPRYQSGYGGQAQLPQQEATPRSFAPRGDTVRPAGRNNLQRQMVRTRFMLSQYPGLITYGLIAFNVIVYIVTLSISMDTLLLIALNMLSLFFIGRMIEALYGPVRYLAIYVVSGLISGLLPLLLASGAGGGLAALFASLGGVTGSVAVIAVLALGGALFGVFGALGSFYLINRRALGVYGNGAIVNWLFWIGLNLAFTLTGGAGMLVYRIGELLVGMLLGWLLMPRMGRRRL
jgi:tetratricopeptide (TPR) repeat protein